VFHRNRSSRRGSLCSRTPNGDSVGKRLQVECGRGSYGCNSRHAAYGGIRLDPRCGPGICPEQPRRWACWNQLYRMYASRARSAASEHLHRADIRSAQHTPVHEPN
jgi:hypothetical protein